MDAIGSRHIGPWELETELGRGANAIVWRAHRDGEAPVALKVVNSTKLQREPYRRFVNEITVLRTLRDQPGILPLLDAYLPAAPSIEDRAWLAMPIARPIRDALTDRELKAVVAAIGEVVATLARLRAEHAIGHRDLKPANLYEHEGRFLVGDFGLVAAPDLEELTRDGQPLGPAHYTASEMILDPSTADPGPADVYSIGKILWVMATAQAYPPEGHQAASIPRFSIADLRPHGHATALDRLVDRCTRLDPQARPTMQQLADDLVAWANLAATPTAVDFTDLRGPLRQRLATELAQEERRDRQQEDATAAVELLQELVRPLDNALGDLHPGARIATNPDNFGANMLKSLQEIGSGYEIVWEWTRMSEVGAGPDYMRYSLRVGRGLSLTSGGDLLMNAFVDLGDPDTSATDFHWPMPEASAPVGSTKAEAMLRDGVAELAGQVREALQIFTERAPTNTG